MPLVVLSLKGDTSDVFDWSRSVTPGEARSGSFHSPTDAL